MWLAVEVQVLGRIRRARIQAVSRVVKSSGQPEAACESLSAIRPEGAQLVTALLHERPDPSGTQA